MVDATTTRTFMMIQPTEPIKCAECEHRKESFWFDRLGYGRVNCKLSEELLRFLDNGGRGDMPKYSPLGCPLRKEKISDLGWHSVYDEIENNITTIKQMLGIKP